MTAERHNVSRRTVLGAGAAATVLAVAGPGEAANLPAELPAAASAPPPPISGRSSPPIKHVCNKCGGHNVTRDAWAEWDVAEQEWVLAATFDYSYCHDCQEETRLEEMAVAASDDREAD